MKQFQTNIIFYRNTNNVEFVSAQKNEGMVEGSGVDCSEVGLEMKDDDLAEKAWMEALGMEEEDEGSE